MHEAQVSKCVEKESKKRNPVPMVHKDDEKDSNWHYLVYFASQKKDRMIFFEKYKHIQDRRR